MAQVDREGAVLPRWTRKPALLASERGPAGEAAGRSVAELGACLHIP